MKKFINNIVYIILVLSLVSITACGKKPKELIVGKWVRTSISNEYPGLFYPSSIAFYEDGSISVGGKELPTDLAGKYNFVDEKNIKLDISAFAQVIVETEVFKDDLKLIFPKGEIAKYERYK